MICFQPCAASQQPKDRTVEMLTLFHLQTVPNIKQTRKLSDVRSHWPLYQHF